MNTDFDKIRCYNNDEIHSVLEQLSNEKQFMKVVSTIYPLLPKDVIKQRLMGYRTNYEFQKNFIYPFLQSIEANLTKGIDLVGIEKINVKQPYLYISNHRDIILDSALLCAKLIERDMDTVEIAIGDNLLVFPWIEELARVNKSFIVRRGLSPRQNLESSMLLSAYIAFTINEKQQSIWLAQREGRAKDGNDKTQESVLKMLNMSGISDFATNLSRLNICPLSISYEYDPCDFLKAKEFQQKRDNPDYKKQAQDDLINMSTGVMGYKGKVVYSITGDINEELKSMTLETKNKNELVTLTAELIDRRIYSNYVIFSVNKIAYDLLNGANSYQNEYTMMEKLDFESYIEKQIQKIDLENRDVDFLRKKILGMYANPLINFLNSNSVDNK